MSTLAPAEHSRTKCDPCQRSAAGQKVQADVMQSTYCIMQRTAAVTVQLWQDWRALDTR